MSVALLFWGDELTANTLPISQYNTTDGLPSSETYSIYQDSKFRYWICTDNGVSLFDGNTFTNFSLDHGLPTNTVFSSFENKNDGRMWFITYGLGLCYYDEGTGKFKPPPFNNKLIKLFNKKFINACQFDKDNNLWISYHDIHLLKVDTKGHITIYPLNPKKEVSGIEITLLEDLQLVRNIEGLLPNSNSNYSIRAIGNRLILNGNFTFNIATPKLLKIDKTTLVMSFLDELLLINSSRSILVKKLPSKILSFIRDKKNNIWLGTEKNGIFILHNSNFSSQPINLPEHKDLTISSLLQDNDGKIWFTTLTSGIFCISNTGINNFLIGKKVQKIAFDKNSLSLITPAGKVYISQKDTFKFKLYAYSDEIKQIKRGPDNKVYICQVVYNKNIPLKLDIKNIAAFTIEFFEKSIVIAGKTNLVTYNYAHQLQKKYDIPSPIFEICRLDDRRLLVGCLNGLYIFSEEGFTLVNGPSWLKTVRVNSIVNYNNQHYILTDGNGILVYQHGKIKPVIQKAGFAVNSVNCIAFENDTTLWIGSSNGLIKGGLNKNGELTLYSKLTINDGLPSNEINDLQINLDKVLVATNNGLSVFNKNLEQTHKIVPLFISAVLGNFKDTLFYGYSRIIDLDLGEKWRNLYIRFSTTRDKTHALFGQLTYRLYKDNALINNWTKISDNNVQFTNLEPGAYTFEVRTTDLVSNDFFISNVNFKINPTFFERIWVRVFFITLIIFIILFGIWILVNKIRYDSDVKRKMIKAEINSLRNQMNPHFIFNALNSIQYFIFENNQEKAAKFLSKFANLIRKSLELSKLNFISIRSEINFIEEYLAIEKLRFNDKFNYTIEVDPNLEIDSFFIPPLLMQPLIENSIKHGFNNKKDEGLIQIKLYIEEKDLLTYAVIDNGKGMEAKMVENPPEHKTSLSHEILKERFILLRKDYARNKRIGMSIRNHVFEEKYGTEIILKLPIKHD